MTSGNGAAPAAAIQTATDALVKLGAKQPDLAASLARILAAVAEEAARTPRFARQLNAASAASGRAAATEPAVAKARARGSRRAPGVLDPFDVYARNGEPGLRAELADLDLEQLRDIVAEQGMDHDGLAMRWRTASRLIDRIVEKVSARAAKGAAFRSA